MTADRRADSAVAIIVIAELFGTSLWFSVNGVADSLIRDWGLDARDLGHLTSAVQAGFIAGTFLFAVSGLADRYSASRIFASCALLGAISNAVFAGLQDAPALALATRFLTGLTLSGIYPIGMKLVMSWAPERAGQMLGWLVGMLVLGTGLPHLVHGSGVHADWQPVLFTASGLAVLAGMAVARLGDGPHHGQRTRTRWGGGGTLSAFARPGFRAAALGYFGHMWELYAFWTAVPFLVVAGGLATGPAASLATFVLFVAGAIGCVVGGLLSRRFGNVPVAVVALVGSGATCLVFPLLEGASPVLLWIVLLAWGTLVVADSPQFSALAAAACGPKEVGGALALMNSIGFAISILSIELALYLLPGRWTALGWLLLPGPLFGLWALCRHYCRPARQVGPGR